MAGLWHLTDRDTRHEQGERKWFDLREVPYSLRSLAQHNPAHGEVHFLVSQALVDECWRLHGTPASSVRDRQLLALLIHHRAKVDAWYGNRLFGPVLQGPYEQDHPDRYGVGSLSPRLWVLGKQLNPRSPDFPLPFGTTAGRNLLWPHVDPYRMRVSNVLEPQEDGTDHHGPRERLFRDWELLGRPQVLVVGKTAGTIYRGPNVLGYLEHPQHTWRFHHDLSAGWSAQFQAFAELAGAVPEAG